MFLRFNREVNAPKPTTKYWLPDGSKTVTQFDAITADFQVSSLASEADEYAKNNNQMTSHTINLQTICDTTGKDAQYGIEPVVYLQGICGSVSIVLEIDKLRHTPETAKSAEQASKIIEMLTNMARDSSLPVKNSLEIICSNNEAEKDQSPCKYAYETAHQVLEAVNRLSPRP